jgi:hypothetical protein
MVIDDTSNDVALFHYPSCPDSIKLSPQFSRNFVVINGSEGSHFFQIFSIGSIDVKCCVAVINGFPVNHVSIFYVFWSFVSFDTKFCRVEED